MVRRDRSIPTASDHHEVVDDQAVRVVYFSLRVFLALTVPRNFFSLFFLCLPVEKQYKLALVVVLAFVDRRVASNDIVPAISSTAAGAMAVALYSVCVVV